MYVIPAINSKKKKKCDKFTVVAQVLQHMQSLAISCSCFANDRNEMYKIYNVRAQQVSWCTVIVLFIEPFV